jgi:hypothetical protein
MTRRMIHTLLRQSATIPGSDHRSVATGAQQRGACSLKDG